MELWCEKALTMKRVMFFAFSLRYLLQFGEKEKSELTEIIKEEFSTITPIINLV